MKLTPDDPRLSAYLLGELSDEEAAQVERAVAADPALRMSFDELREMTALMERSLASERDERLLPAQRQAVIRAGRDRTAGGKVVAMKSARRDSRPWLAGLAAAAAVTVAALIGSRMDLGPEGEPALGGAELAMMPLPGPGNGSIAPAGSGGSTPGGEQLRRLETGADEQLAKAGGRRAVPAEAPEHVPVTGSLAEFSEDPALRLPVVLGNSSLAWVSHAIREQDRLPKRDLVRVEELVNACALPGDQERLRVESMPCPWAADSILVAVQLTAGVENLSEVELRSVSPVPRRMLGSFVVCDDGHLPKSLPAGRRTLVMLEAKRSDEVSKIELTVGGASESRVAEPAADEVSPGIRHAALMAGFGLWLRGEGVEAADLERMLAAERDRDPIREDQRRLVRRALELAQ